MTCLCRSDVEVGKRFFYLLIHSSEEWKKVGDMERKNLGITVEDDGEFW